MEIERKFLVKKVPEDLEKYKKSSLEQGYISTSPTIRIRRHDDRYILTCKGKGTLSREEFELDITESKFYHLKTKVEGNWIKKTRYFIPIENNLTIELDIFDEPFAPLVYAEVEFPDEATAKAFIPPEWFGEDVTYQTGYSNAALSKKVLSKDITE